MSRSIVLENYAAVPIVPTGNCSINIENLILNVRAVCLKLTFYLKKVLTNIRTYIHTIHAVIIIGIIW
jgi:hypothetical protein